MMPINSVNDEEKLLTVVSLLLTDQGFRWCISASVLYSTGSVAFLASQEELIRFQSYGHPDREKDGLSMRERGDERIIDLSTP